MSIGLGPSLALGRAAVTAIVPAGARVFGAYSEDGLAGYTTTAGRAPKIWHGYQKWGDVANAFSDAATAILNPAFTAGAMPMLTWESWAGTVTDSTYKLTTITAGSHDTYINAWAAACATDGRTFFLRLDQEMNLAAVDTWSCGPSNPNGNVVADYVAAWRYIHAKFVAAGATNVRWVWCPNVLYSTSPSFASLYPGDAYVDWVALDGYNDLASNQSFRTVMGISYEVLRGMTRRPILIAETASIESLSDKAAWITDAYLTAIPTYLPEIAAVAWFDANYGGVNNYRIDSSSPSKAAYVAAAADPTWHGSLSATTADLPTITYAPANVSGLLASYDCNQGSGSQLTDSSGHAFHGTLGAGGAAPTWVTEGLSFNGSNYVTLPSGAFNSNELTIMQVVPQHTAGSLRTMSFAFAGTEWFEVRADPSNSSYLVKIQNAAASSSFPGLGNNKWPVNVWDAIALRINLSAGTTNSAVGSKVYYPNVNTGNVVIVGAASAGYLGRDVANANRWDKKMGYVLIYNRQLLDQEIAYLYEFLRDAMAARGVSLA